MGQHVKITQKTEHSMFIRQTAMATPQSDLTEVCHESNQK